VHGPAPGAAQRHAQVHRARAVLKDRGAVAFAVSRGAGVGQEEEAARAREQAAAAAAAAAARAVQQPAAAQAQAPAAAQAQAQPDAARGDGSNVRGVAARVAPGAAELERRCWARLAAAQARACLSGPAPVFLGGTAAAAAGCVPQQRARTSRPPTPSNRDRTPCAACPAQCAARRAAGARGRLSVCVCGSQCVSQGCSRGRQHTGATCARRRPSRGSWRTRRRSASGASSTSSSS